MNDDDRDPDTAPGGHDWRIEQDMQDAADAERHRASDPRRMTRVFEADAENASRVVLSDTGGELFPADDVIDADLGRRHVLNIEPDGWSYIAPHRELNHPRSECDAVAAALLVFQQRSHWPDVDGSVMVPGVPVTEGDVTRRFWVSVDEGGLLLIGGRVA